MTRALWVPKEWGGARKWARFSLLRLREEDDEVQQLRAELRATGRDHLMEMQALRDKACSTA